MRCPDGVKIEAVGGGFREEKEMLPRTRQPILDARRHVIWFVPDDVVPQNPAAPDHLDSKPLRDQAERFPWNDLLKRRRPQCQDSCRMEWEGVLGPVLPAESVANRREDRAAAPFRVFLQWGRRGYRP